MRRPGEMIPFGEIGHLLERASGASPGEVDSIIRKARSLEGLTPYETGVLLCANGKDVTGAVFEAARDVKEAVYGRRLVLFAPLYLSNLCENDCLYCGFRRGNKELGRRVLTLEEIRSEAEAIIEDGHKRVLVVAGEDRERCGIDYIEKAVRAIYSVGTGGGKIRRVNVNVAPLTEEGFRRLKSIHIGTYQLFQETYHPETYKKMHPNGPKSDFHNRLAALDMAQEAGIDDVGMGVLFGLHDYRFEVLALVYHSLHLEARYGVGPHTISVPRIEPANNAPVSLCIPYEVSDDDFMKIIAVLRLAVPYTGLIISTRERAEFRDRLLGLGVSQISANSRTSPGGYTLESGGRREEQFSIADKRTTEDVIRDISRYGFSPSFCTACYRTGRTGSEFMGHAKPGEIQRFCLPNSILSFKEYLIDYGSDDLREIGDGLIKEQITGIKDRKMRTATLRKIEEIEGGKRDLYF